MLIQYHLWSPLFLTRRELLTLLEGSLGTSHFSLAFKIFSLSLIFSVLTTMCLFMGLFVNILL